jgi:YbgC/YbaW family acyl-CoA thioester hydrolase
LSEPFVYRHRVRWVDTDASGIIHFTAVFRFTEAAEVEWLRHAGVPLGRLMAERGLSVPRVHVAADFRRPLRFDDALAIAVRPGRLGRSSLALGFEIRREEDDPVAPAAVTVDIVLVCTDAGIGGAVPWPEEVRSAFVAHGARPG